jgi:hypothetical protein
MMTKYLSFIISSINLNILEFISVHQTESDRKRLFGGTEMSRKFILKLISDNIRNGERTLKRHRF